MEEKFLNLIGGRWVPALSEEWFEDRNPADWSEVVGLFPLMGERDAFLALEAAQGAFGQWRRKSWYERGALLRRASQLLRERAERVARDLVREMGKTLREALGEVNRAADFLEFYGSLGRWSVGDLLPHPSPSSAAMTMWEPVGVVLAITPWNDPILSPARKLGPALLAGNTVILKPASLTPLSAWHLVKVLDEAGLPAGVLNLVTGPGNQVVEPLLGSGAIAAVSFTGSTEVGLEISRLAGPKVRVQAEMGGKNASVIMPDAPMDLALEYITISAFGQSGQRCTATSRVLVHEQVYEEFTEKFVSRVKAIRVGPGLEPESQMGPVVSEQQMKSVLDFVEEAKRHGAVLLAGGSRLLEKGLEKGFFVSPTVIEVMKTDLPIWCEEVFGPVVVLRSFSSLEEAIELTNGTRYGLAASIFTQDLEAACAFAQEVDVGNVAVNLPTVGWDVHIPFGGFKDSGLLHKEQGVEGLRFYVRCKSLAIRYRFS